MPNQILDGYVFDFDPPMGNWSGIFQAKSRADLGTLQGNITFNWGFVDYKPVKLSWPALAIAQWDILYAKWTKNSGKNTYIYQPIQTGVQYIVEIVDLVGVPFGSAFNYKYYVDVTMTLKVLGVQS